MPPELAFASAFAGGLAALDLIAYGFTLVWDFFKRGTLG